MIEEFSLQTVLTYLTLISVPVGVFYHIMILRNAQKTRELSLKSQEGAEKARQRDMILQRASYGMEYPRAYIELRSMTDWKDVEEWYEKYGNNPEALSRWVYLMRLYALGGLLLKEGTDPELVFELYPPNTVMNLWERFEPVLRFQREESNYQRRGESFEYLYNEAKKRYPYVSSSWR
jgi:hypothetical protein